MFLIKVYVLLNSNVFYKLANFQFAVWSKLESKYFRNKSRKLGNSFLSGSEVKNQVSSLGVILMKRIMFSANEQMFKQSLVLGLQM